jgi:hypothetical protein
MHCMGQGLRCEPNVRPLKPTHQMLHNTHLPALFSRDLSYDIYAFDILYVTGITLELRVS